MTQKEFAERSGIRRTNISHIWIPPALAYAFALLMKDFESSLLIGEKYA